MSAITAGAVIAAGEGSRLKALGVAKPLVEEAGVPLIEHVLRNFEAAGIVSAAVIFNESERDCEAFVRERFGRLVSTVDAFCPQKDFVRFVERAAALPSDATVLAVTRFVDDEKPLWVNVAGDGRVSAVGGSKGDAVTAGIYVFPEKVRSLGIPRELGRLRDFLAWLARSGAPIQAVEIEKVVDVDRAEDLAVAEELAAER